MKAIFGWVGLVLALALVGILVKKQVATTSAPVPALQGVTGNAAGDATVRGQSQQVQQQVKQQVESLMQQPRPMPAEEK